MNPCIQYGCQGLHFGCHGGSVCCVVHAVAMPLLCPNLCDAPHMTFSCGACLQAEIEMAQAREAEESSRQAEQQRRQAEADEGDEASDAAVMRARAMDEWKDDHPRGYGNSKLRPTA